MHARLGEDRRKILTFADPGDHMDLETGGLHRPRQLQKMQREVPIGAA